MPPKRGCCRLGLALYFCATVGVRSKVVAAQLDKPDVLLGAQQDSGSCETKLYYIFYDEGARMPPQKAMMPSKSHQPKFKTTADGTLETDSLTASTQVFATLQRRTIEEWPFCEQN